MQSEDDHEELLASANAALSIDFTFKFFFFNLHWKIYLVFEWYFSCAGPACASTFWRQVEPFFAFLTAEDITYLSQQVTWVIFYCAKRHIYFTPHYINLPFLVNILLVRYICQMIPPQVGQWKGMNAKNIRYLFITLSLQYYCTNKINLVTMHFWAVSVCRNGRSHCIA